MRHKRVVCISDIQAPYHHKDTLGFLKRVKKDVKPDLIVCLGDELDQHTLSRYPATMDAPDGASEYRAAIDLWRSIYAVYPRALSVTSNHVQRISKRAAETGIPSAYLKETKEFMQAPEGWYWNDKWVVDDIQYEHGERAGSGPNGLRALIVANMRSTVIGHYHESPGTQWINNGERCIWGLNVGSLVNADSHGLSYTRNNRHKPVAGLGVILDGCPRFIPYY